MTDVIVWTYVNLWPNADEPNRRGAQVAQLRPGLVATVAHDRGGYTWTLHTETLGHLRSGHAPTLEGARLAAIESGLPTPKARTCEIDDSHEHPATWVIDGRYRRTKKQLATCDAHMAKAIAVIRTNGCDPLYNPITNFHITPAPGGTE